jgi:hypothetical protein
MDLFVARQPLLDRLAPRRVADMYVAAVGWGTATTALAD